MNPESDFEALLRRQLEQPELPDRGFTLALSARVARRRRWRIGLFAGAASIAGMAIVAGTVSGSSVPVAMLAITPTAAALTLLLAGLCSYAWIDSESSQ